MNEPIVQGEWITPNQKLKDALNEFNEIKFQIDKLGEVHEQMAKALQKVKDAQSIMSEGSSMPEEVTLLPGVEKMVKDPVTGHTRELFYVIMSLNDGEHWTREQIADWIQTLDVDTTFKTVYTETEQEEETQ